MITDTVISKLSKLCSNTNNQWMERIIHETVLLARRQIGRQIDRKMDR